MEIEGSGHKVMLLHGFSKNKKDMMELQANLSRHHFACMPIDLPLTFKSIEHCAVVLEGIFDGLVPALKTGEKISLVGHSSGGLVIRKFLSDTKHLDRVNKCILIATPNQGSELADFLAKVSRTGVKIFKTLESIRGKSVRHLNMKETDVKVGVIAGNNSNLLLGKLLKGDNDGRVTVESVYFDGMYDFIVLPYGHKDIHYRKETADLIRKFIASSKFKL
ncbi:alpha/beta fold hydrolase [Paenibacillus beijingensis]|uniref:Alpha/beta hydrolase n=1 Tax=Paenibacillus beijingensis TaxID=1126833 RepID=A0A0D5NGJ7_9BACL|nr:alpha/beta fold hydrolase [Paenibacillus beijingensis]AJY74240.1 alpha/beta hydrolase [Paenibacillus beijingensis]